MSLMRREHSGKHPLLSLRDWEEEVERFLRFPFGRKETWLSRFEPEMDVKEESDRYIVKADVPGLKKEDMEISVHGKYLTLKGERKEEKETKAKDYYYAERLFGSFSRTLELPTEVKDEDIKAVYKDGVLEIILPKSETAKSKQIKVEIK